VTGKIASLTRHVVGNRRRHRRQHHKYDTIVRDEVWREVFRGSTVDLSISGAKLSGFPAHTGVFEGQNVTIEFLLVPKEIDKVAQRVPMPAHVCRVVEKDDEYVIGVMFDRQLG